LNIWHAHTRHVGVDITCFCLNGSKLREKFNFIKSSYSSDRISGSINVKMVYLLFSEVSRFM